MLNQIAKERRAFGRTSVQASGQAVLAPAPFSGTRARCLSVRLRDVSLHGASFAVPIQGGLNPLMTGMQLELRLHVGSSRLVLPAEVMWTRNQTVFALAGVRILARHVDPQTLAAFRHWSSGSRA